MGVAEFKAHLEKVASDFKQVNKPVKLVSNLDADGISAAAVMVRALERLNITHSVRIIHQLREEEMSELAEEDYDFYVFTDLGSGALPLIEKYLKGRNALVLDHHHPNGDADNVWHVNPHLFGIDGSDEISAAGVAFFFAQALDKANEDMSHIALLGAIGDVQEHDGFSGMNSEILNIAVKKGLVKVEKDLNLYGRESRPLHKLLEYSSDMKIPGVTGSESSVVQFLNSIGIDPQVEGQWRYLGDLSAEEKQRLIAGIVMKRVELENPEDIFTKAYVINGEEGVFRSAKEFATLLNACGRLDKASIGIGACLGKPDFKKKALQVQAEYKKEIVYAMNWFRDNDKTEYVQRGENYIIINAENQVRDTMIGTIISILSKAGNYPDGTFMLSMARKPNKVTKVSIRVVGNPDVNLREIIDKLAAGVGGEAGGHQYAAGAIISTEKEQDFIEAAKKSFTQG
ncbi:DHHA1 domain-containing protein [Nanoarchaeota archaeon]